MTAPRPTLADEYALPGGADDPRSLAERIRQFVLERIESGAWPEGHRLPAETELAALFGTARMTVHGALRDLAAAGILLRRPRAGTTVAPRRPQSTLLEVRNIQDEIQERGHQHAAVVRKLVAEPCDLATATELEVPAGSPVFHSVIVHLENGRPIQIEDRHVRQAFAPEYLGQDFTVRTPNEYLTRMGSLDEVEYVIQAVVPDKPTRQLLKIPEATPVLQVRRRTWSDGIVVTSARLIHPGDSYSLVGRIAFSHRARA